MSASRSRNTTNNTTTFTLTDSRSVSDSRTWNVNDSYNTYVSMTDGGAVAAAHDLSIAAMRESSTNTRALFDLADRLLNRTQASLDASAKLAQSMASNTVDIASGNKTVMVVAMGVIGAVAVLSMK